MSRYVSFMIACVLTAGGIESACAQDREPTSARRGEFKFAIPAQQLSTALRQFSEVTGLQLIYTAELVRDLRSSAIDGSMSADVALQTMLAGTGVTHRFVRDSVVTLEKSSAAAGVRTLGPVRVEGAETRGASVNGINGSHDVTATEGTHSFTTGAMTIGTKEPRSIKETTQSVSVLTHEQLEQQNINDFTRALQQAPGISFEQGSSSLENIFYSRGFRITSIQIDGGAPLTTFFASGDSAYFPLIDLAQYDHVEVLRGAAGLFNGYGDASGTVNLVRKKPLDHQQVTLDTEGGSWSNYRAALDATAPLGFDGALRGRFVTTWQTNKYFYNLAEDKKSLFYGVLSYDLTPSTLVMAGISRSSQNSVPWAVGLPRYQTGGDLHLSRDTSFVFPWNRWQFDTTEIFSSIEQGIGDNWTAKLNLTRNEQSSTQKVGNHTGTVIPGSNTGPRLSGIYRDYAADQLSAEATLSGHFSLFGQRQEITLGVNRSNQDGGDRKEYLNLVASSAAVPYQPYPSGPRYCYTASTTKPCPAGTIGPASPPIDVFAFDPYQLIYSEPANPLPDVRYGDYGQVKTLAYTNVRLTAFDRLHLETGLRWSRFEYKYEKNFLCAPVSTPCTGGLQPGDVSSTAARHYSGETVSWPPSVSLSYDVTKDLTTYLGYTDIYVDQSSSVDGDLNPLDPITGENIELGFKWAPREGRLNATLSVYHIKKEGFPQLEPNIADRYKRNPDGSIYRNASGQKYVIANDGSELPEGQLDVSRTCCYVRRQDQMQISDGVDTEVTGEVLPGWQVSASYTFSRNKTKGKSYGASEGNPFLSIQPEHLYKLWTSFDFGAAGAAPWLSKFTLSAGANGQSSGYRSGSVCPDNQVGPPRLDGTALCLVSTVNYEFTVEPYTVFSSRVDYKLNGKWSAALNIENVLDKTYYQTVGTVTGGNWYGKPRSYTLSVRGLF